MALLAGAGGPGALALEVYQERQQLDALLAAFANTISAPAATESGGGDGGVASAAAAARKSCVKNSPYNSATLRALPKR